MEQARQIATQLQADTARRASWPVPSQPDLRSLELLHRAADGYITFHDNKAAHGFRDLCAIRVSELRTTFPLLLELLLEDSYVSVNGMFCAKDWGTNRLLPGLPRPQRKTGHLRYLNACYIDLDSHRLGLDFWDVFAALERRQEAGLLPPASILSRSGRGLWAFWLLQETDGSGRPPRAYPDQLALYDRIQQALYGRLADLGADAAALDAVRITRVPGSRNTKAEPDAQLVAHWPQGAQDGQAVLYTLKDLAAFFEIKPPERKPFTQRASNEEERARKRKGWRARWIYCLKDFEVLRERRGRFQTGCRHRACLYYAFLLKRVGLPEEDISAEVFRLARECQPPLALREARDCLREGIRLRPVLAHGSLSYRRLSEDLHITPLEAQYLQKLAPCQRYAPCTQETLAPPVPPLTIQARRAKILDIIQGAAGYIPPVRQMAELLIGMGIPVGRSTVQSDYEALRIEPPARQGKRRVTADSCPLPENLTHA